MTPSDETLPERSGRPPADPPPRAAPASDEARPRAAEGEDAGNGTSGAVEGEPADEAARPREIGGQAGPEPTRYGDWEKKGRCTDF